MSKLKFDHLDLKIVTVLQRKGNITNLKLADEIGLSTSPCLERVKRLERSGVIKSYYAEIDASRIVSHIFSYVQLTLKSHERENFRKFEKYCIEHPFVLECCLVSGNFDYMVKIVSRDIEHFHSIMDNMMSVGIGISTHFTYVIIKRAKDTLEIPIKLLKIADEEANYED